MRKALTLTILALLISLTACGGIKNNKEYRQETLEIIQILEDTTSGSWSDDQHDKILMYMEEWGQIKQDRLSDEDFVILAKMTEAIVEIFSYKGNQETREHLSNFLKLKIEVEDIIS